MYNIFITTKNTPRKLVAQVEDPRVFLRKRYESLSPVWTDSDCAIWKSGDDSIEAYRIVEQIFAVPLEEPLQKDPPKTKRESGYYWCTLKESVHENLDLLQGWIACRWFSDERYWWIPGINRAIIDNEMCQIDEHRLERQLIKPDTATSIIPGDERAYAGDLGKTQDTPEQVFEQIREWLSSKYSVRIVEGKILTLVYTGSHTIHLHTNFNDRSLRVDIEASYGFKFRGCVEALEEFKLIWNRIL